MGVVYKAEDTKLGRTVALKFLPNHLTSNEEENSRFLQEAKAAATLNHPNICSIYYLEEIGEQRFIVMEFVDGETLRKKVPIQKTEEVIQYAIQICEALQEAHSKEIVHRDIKADNIMVNSKYQIKVMDFGLAKLKGSLNLTRTSSTVGTLAYMAPEQIQGGDADQQSDIFSFGVVLFEMLSGKLPFRGEHEAAIMYSILNEEPIPLSSLRPNISESIQSVVLRCLQKDKQKRYQSMTDVISDLKKLQSGMTVPKQPVEKNLPTRFWIIAATVLIVIIVGAYFFFISNSPIVKQQLSIGKSAEDISLHKSIAILPFENLSDDKENEYFSDGITEDIITQLSKIADLKVISRTSVMQYKHTEKNMRQIGKELGVGTVLEGSVRRSGNQLRISAELIDANTDEHLWANTFDREMKDVFAVQDDITGHIVSALTITLNGTERQAMSSSRTANPAAHDLYLQGRFYFNQLTGESLNRSIEYYQKAIQEDSGYAEPYAGIAYAYEALADFYLPPHEAYPRAKNAARKALEIDSTNGVAHAALGTILTEYDWDFPAGEQELQRAVQLSPNSVDVNIFYAQCAGIRGNMEDALAHADRAITLDPLSPIASWSKEWYLFWARNYDGVIAQCKKTAELDSTLLYWDDFLGAAYREKGMLKESLQEYLKAQKNSPDRPLFGLAITYARMGNQSDARKVLRELEEVSKKRYVAADQIAMIYANLGENDKAFEYLEQAYQAHAAGMSGLKIYPEYDPIRSDPRFEILLKKVGIAR